MVMYSKYLKAQWENTVHEHNMVTRLNIKHSLEFYIGYDHMCNMVLTTKSKYKVEKTASTKSIVCTMNYCADSDDYWYIFCLQDISKKEIFLDMCADIINYSAHEDGKSRALNALRARYESWQDMLKKSGSELLSDAVQRGLLGELTFLYRRLKDNNENMKTVIAGWQGPEREKRDFLLDDKWYEIKTIKQGVTGVRISSLSQLDTDGNGYLVVYILEKASDDNKKAVSLAKLVKIIYRTLEDVGAGTDLFTCKLLKYGYDNSREEYAKNSYIVREEKKYLVNDTFPVLTEKNVPEQVVRAEYELNVAQLADWLETKEETGDLYNGL